MPKLRPHLSSRELVARNFNRLVIDQNIAKKFVSQKSGVSRSVIDKIQDATTGVTIDVLGRIAEAIDKPLHEFFRL